MRELMFIEFSSKFPLRRIYDQLVVYHHQNYFVKTNYNGTILSNENLDILKETITRLELGLTEEEYQKYKVCIKVEKERVKLYNARLITPKVVRYWIEKAKQFLASDKQNDWEKACYLLIHYANEKELPEIRRQAIEFAYQTIISAAKIIIALQNESDNKRIDDIAKVIDNELYYSEDNHQLNNKYETLNILIPYVTDKGDLYRKLTFYDEVNDENKYNQPIEEFLTKKKIPNYLK